MQSQKLLSYLLLAGCIVCMAQVWIPHYYLTGDGPCHLYNAKVLHDIWNGNNVVFYSRFYQVIYQPNPNWLSHILLSLPMHLFSGAVSEKIFLTIYAGLMLGGFYLLLKKVSPGFSYWPLLIFLLLFNHTLAKGFYNFNLATAFYLWMVVWWMRFMEDRSNKHAIIFFCFTAFTFFTQLLPFVFGVFTCFALAISYAAGKEDIVPKRPMLFFLKNTITLSIFTAPFIFLMLWFITKEHGLGLTIEHHFYRVTELIRLKYFVTASRKEEYFTAIAGIVVVALLLVALVTKFKSSRRIHQYDGLLFSLGFVMVCYLFFPDDFLNRVILIGMRAQLFAFILMVACIGYMLPATIKNAGGGILFICFLALSVVRFPVLLKASEGCADYNSAVSHISPNSVVLPLDFAPSGKDEAGNVISDGNYLFTHAAHYGGTEKPLILLDNYEALTGYFPLLWTYDTNPYQHLSKWEGIEAQPPGADIEGYTNATDVKIDYVLLWCYDTAFLKRGHYAALDSQIQRGFHLVYTSATKRTILYERNK